MTDDEKTESDWWWFWAIVIGLSLFVAFMIYVGQKYGIGLTNTTRDGPMVLLSIDVSPLLDMAWTILCWTVDYVWILCGTIFVLIMVKTLFDISKKVVDMSAPGLNKLLGGSRRRG